MIVELEKSKTMKHLRNMLLLLAVVVLFSCGEDFQGDIDKLNEQHTNIEQRVSKLEAQVTAINTQLTQLSVLANAVEQNFYITKVKTTSDGYELTLSNGNVIVLQKGADNVLLPAPAISMTQLNGFFYWTLNGMLLTDGGGQPIRTRGLAPVVKYDFISQQWVVSVDGGITFQDVNVMASVVINDEILLQIINNYIEQHSSTLISQDVLYQIISTYIQQNYAQLFNIEILDEVVANYVNQRYTRIFSYELLEKIFTQYNFEYATSQIDVEQLKNVLISFMQEHQEIFLDNEVLYEIISSYITVNKTSIFTDELLLEVINTFIANNENFINVELLTQVVNNYIDQHRDVVFNTETCRKLMMEYIKKYYVQIFSQDILIRLVNTYVTRNSATIFNKTLIEEVINNFVTNNYNTVISNEILHEIINNYIRKNSTTIINRDLLVEIISSYFERNYNVIIDIEVIRKEVYDYIERHKTTIIDVDIIRSVVNNYLEHYYKEVFSYEMLTKVVHNYFEQNRTEIFQYISKNSDIIKDVNVSDDVCTISLKDGRSVRLVIYDSYARLRDRVQSIVVLPNEKGRIDVGYHGDIYPRYLVTPSAMAQIICDMYYDKEFTIELKAADEYGNISTISIYEPTASNGVLSFGTYELNGVKAVALHVKDNKPGGTDIMTEFTPIGEESSSRGYLKCPDDNHPHMIDLGLPSGTLWACCNVGATTPYETGGYYAWGETWTKDTYTYGSYQHKSLTDSYTWNFLDIGSDISGTQYDAAFVLWGAEWRMPTREQLSELVNYTEYSLSKGDKELRFTGSNGGTIYLPLAGYYGEKGVDLDSYYFRGGYWSSIPDEQYDFCADILRIGLRSNGLYDDNLFYVPIVSVGSDAHSGRRYEGLVIRPVAAPE